MQYTRYHHWDVDAGSPAGKARFIRIICDMEHRKVCLPTESAMREISILLG